MDDADRQENKLSQIRARAYELWESEGRPEGRQDVHWRLACEEFAETETAGQPQDEATPDVVKESVESPPAAPKRAAKPKSPRQIKT